PFLALGREEVLRDVLAQRGRDHLVLLQLVARLVQVVRQVVDAQPPLLAMRHFPDVLVHRLAPVGLGLDPVEACRQHHCERQIRIGRRIGHAVFYTGAGAATYLTTKRNVAIASAVDNASAYRKSISCCPCATSWCDASTSNPICSSVSTIARRASSPRSMGARSK